MDERKKTRFFWGVLLAWVPTIPLALAFVHIPRDIPTSKAIGLGAVAGMLAEAYLTLGIGLTLVFEVAAYHPAASSLFSRTCDAFPVFYRLHLLQRSDCFFLRTVHLVFCF
jgi:hypothetical protein